VPIFVDSLHDPRLAPYALGCDMTARADDAEIALTLSTDQTTPDGSINVSVDITNTSSLPGDEVVQFYGHERICTVKQPNQKLVGFQRVHLNAGEKKTVTLQLPANRMQIYDEKQHHFTVEPGEFEVMAGSSSADIRARGCTAWWANNARGHSGAAHR